MLWEFKKNRDASETILKIYSIYSRGIITNCQVQNCLAKFCSDDMSLRDETRLGHLSDLNQDIL